MRCPKIPRILAALLVALLAPLAAQAFVLYHSPADDGANPGQPGAIPIGAGNKVLYLYVDNGTTATPADPCAGTGVGDEICMWDIHITCDPNVTVVGFVGDPAASVVANPQPASLQANGGDPLAGTLGPARVGELTVSATGTGDCTLVGEAWVDTGLNANATAMSVVASACNDDDLDELCNPVDPCISFSNSGPGGLDDANGDGIPNVCQCGDANLNDTIDNNDLSSTFFCIQNPGDAGCATAMATGKADANNNDTWDNNDLTVIFAALGGGPSTNYQLTCANRPEGTPPP